MRPAIPGAAVPPRAADMLDSRPAPAVATAWRWALWLARFVAALLAAALVARGLYFVWLAAAYIRWPYESTFGEGTLLAEALRLEGGVVAGLRAIYGPLAPDRFIAGNYPPLFIALWALKPGPAAFPTGRLLSIGAGVVAALAGAATVYVTAPGPRPTRAIGAFLGAGALLCTLPVLQQLGVAKPDMVALALVACGLALFETLPSRRGAALAGIVFALALLTKQSAGFGLAAATLASLGRRPRQTVPLVGAAAATLLATLGGLFLVAGPSLYDHLVRFNVRSWHASQAWRFTERFTTLHWSLLTVALAVGAWSLVKRRDSAYAFYPFVALGVLPTAGSDGGGRLYYLELCLAMAIAAGLAVSYLLASRQRAAVPAAVATLLLLGLFTRTAYSEFRLGRYVPAPRTSDGGRIYLQLMRLDGTSDPVLSEEPGLVAMRRRDVIIDDSYLADVLRRRGLWDNAQIVAAVAEEQYNAIFVRDTNEEILRARWGNAFVDALLAHYRDAGDATFVPRSR